MIKDKKEPIITISLSEADLKIIQACFDRYLKYLSSFVKTKKDIEILKKYHSDHWRLYNDMTELKTLFTRYEKKLEKLKEHMESLQ